MQSRLRFQCPRCGDDLGEVAPGRDDSGEIVCSKCGTRCVVTRTGRAAGSGQAVPAVKVVPTGTAATVRHV